MDSQWKQFCVCSWSKKIVVLSFVDFSIIFLTKLREIRDIVIKNMSVYLASKNLSSIMVWRDNSICFIEKVGLTWLLKQGRKRGREEFAVRQSLVKTDIRWERTLYLGEQKLTFKLDPCWFLTAFPFGPWRSSRLYVSHFKVLFLSSFCNSLWKLKGIILSLTFLLFGSYGSWV